MAEDLNELLENLTFSEEESKRVFSSNRFSTNPKGYEAWAIGKKTSNERINKGAMYRVLRSLWFTKEEMDRQTALEMGEAIGEVMAIDWRDRDGGWTNISEVQVGGTTQRKGNWRNGVEFLDGKQGSNTETKVNEERSGEENETMRVIEKEKTKTGEEEFGSSSPIEKRPIVASLMEGEEVDGHVDPNQRKSSWVMLRRVGSSVKETWIISGDFNAILNEAEKEGGRRKPRALMDYFREVVEELSLVDLKTEKGWFAWVNILNGNVIVNERLDRFMISANDVANFPFIETKVVRQSKSDHDAIFLDTMGRKPNECSRDPRLRFRYDVCWAKETAAKNIIKSAWGDKELDVMGKIKKVG
ncbi:hypothetical protein Gogos_022224 [Gossypium gossypioides]|uniref:Reverse transcriptase n=1 Tax=Gossypium gossypioides TaxID=34282 RepID=A0A7J9D788_GOSGO|nr:hypothetical protein [Gossypium gossypioides]